MLRRDRKALDRDNEFEEDTENEMPCGGQRSLISGE
jgi:hypothetical protein